MGSSCVHEYYTQRHRAPVERQVDVEGSMTGLTLREKLEASVAVQSLVDALELALKTAVDLIESDYAGTSAYAPMMADLEPARAALAKARGQQDNGGAV